MPTGTGGAAARTGMPLVLWVLLALAWCATIQVRPLLDPDEGRYAEIPREMLASGDLVTPRFNGLKYFEKPPLQYWATAAVYRVGGVREWSSRAWTFALAFGCLPLVGAWVAARHGRPAALAAVVALGVSPYFVILGHLNLLDAAFTFWLTAAVLAFTGAQCAPEGSASERRGMLAAWALAALAVLSKGIVVGVLAGAAVTLYALCERDVRLLRRLHLLPGLALFAVLAAPWFIAVSVRNPGFPGFFFVHEHFARFLTTVHQRVEPWWFFLPLVLLAVLPWLAFGVRGCRQAWTDAGVSGEGGAAPPRFRPLRFLLIYAAVVLGFFSASGSKLAPYVLPMVPVLAALTGIATAQPERLARHASRVGATLALVVAAGLLVYSARRNAFVPQAAAAWAAAAAAVALALLVASGVRRLPQPVLLGATLAGASLMWQFLMCAFAAVPPARSARDLAAAARPHIGPQTPLYSVGQYRETLSPYLGRTLQLVDYEGELRFGQDEEPWRRLNREDFVARWSAGGPAVAFFAPEVWDALRRQGLPGCVIAADSHTVAVSRP